MNFTQYKNKLNSDIEIVRKEDENGFSYDAFENVDEKLLLNEKDIGNRVWIASETRTTTAFLTKIGEDGYHIKFQGEIPIRVYYKDEVIIHPDLWNKKRLEFKQTFVNRFA